VSEQTKNFDKQSLRYVVSAINDEANIGWLFDTPQFCNFKPENILDVGCGGGANLAYLANRFGVEGYGVEPSEEAVSILKENYKQSNINFQRASAHHMPFDSDKFDLVIIWSVLHWVGRNEYLQTIGELIRVTKKYLLIMDFSPVENYRTPYHHDKRFYTYKMDFEPIVLNSGVMAKECEMRWYVNQENNEIIHIDEESLTPLLNNELNYHARKMNLFRKDNELLPIYHADDFGVL